MNLPTPCSDASRMAYLFAMRKDWSDRTIPWQPWMQEVLFQVAQEIDADARGALEPNPFEDPS